MFKLQLPSIILIITTIGRVRLLLACKSVQLEWSSNEVSSWAHSCCISSWSSSGAVKGDFQ